MFDSLVYKYTLKIKRPQRASRYYENNANCFLLFNLGLLPYADSIGKVADNLALSTSTGHPSRF
jgi:hypothetical protein